jgi:hypothetical protein
MNAVPNNWYTSQKWANPFKPHVPLALGATLKN